MLSVSKELKRWRPGEPATPSLLSGSTGLRQCHAGISFRIECVLGLRRFEGGEDDGGCFLDHFQAFSEQGGVAIVELDIRSGGVSGVESDGGSNHNRNCFGFCLAHGFGGGDTALGTM
jgi:hypothetical protein